MNDAAGNAVATNSAAERRTPLLRAQQVSKFYPDGLVAALVDVELEVFAGEYVAIIGPSGSGKSTLLNLLGALDRPSSGEIFFDGKPLSAITDLDGLRARQIGFVFQSFHLLPMLTAAENVQTPMFEGPLGPAARAARAAELLELVGMAHRADHLPKQLSVGERQRVAIARSLANRPPLLLADEPTGNLDTKTAHAVFDLLDRLHRQQGVTIVLITHDRELAARAQRVFEIRDGRLSASR